MVQPVTPKSSAKLSDALLRVLSRASQREDGAAELLERMTEKAAHKLALALLEKKLVRKVKALNGKPVWMQGEEGACALVITKLGRAAINVPEEENPEVVDEAVYIPATPSADVQATPINETALTKQSKPRDGSKLAEVIELLCRDAGVRIEELTSVTGWLPHTTRAALTGLRKRGYAVERTRAEGSGGSIYRILATAAQFQAA